MSNIRFGLVLPTNNLKMLIQLAIKSNQAGFDSIWMADHLMGIGAPDCLDPWTILSTLSSYRSISTIFGTAVTNPHRLHPAYLAQTAMTLDRLSKGRFILGLGTGAPMNLEPYGIDSTNLLRRLRESIEIIRLLWKGVPITYKGEIFSLKRAMIRPTPVQDPLPIWLAANSSNTLRLTGELADGWMPVRLSPTLMREDKKIIEESARNAGRNIHELTYSYFMFSALGKTKDKIMAKVRGPAKITLLYSLNQVQRLGYEVDSIDFNPSHFNPSIDGYDQLFAKAKEIPDAAIEDCYAIGSPDDVIEKIEQYIRIAGCRYFLLCPYIMPNPKTFLKLFSDEVLPHFKDL